MRTHFSYILSICGGLVLACNALAITVHTWKDEHGVTHFSDSPSPAGVDSESINFDQLEKKTTEHGDDYYSISNQWQRLKAERDATNARRDAKAQLRAAEAERQAALELQHAANAPQNSYPVFGPINGGGYWGGPGIWNRNPNARYGRDHHQHRPYNAKAYNARGRHARVHPNYYSPFHDRVQPRSIRPKPLTNRAGGYRGRPSSGFSVKF